MERERIYEEIEKEREERRKQAISDHELFLAKLKEMEMERAKPSSEGRLEITGGRESFDSICWCAEALELSRS